MNIYRKQSKRNRCWFRLVREADPRHSALFAIYPHFSMKIPPKERIIDINRYWEESEEVIMRGEKMK